MIKTYRILILEDDLSALSVLMDRLFRIEQILGEKKHFDFAVTVYSEYTQVEKFVNPFPNDFDLILLDRDCRLCGSFHALDIEKFNPDKIIAISTYPDYNQAAKERGVKISCRKDYKKLREWGDEVGKMIIGVLGYDT